VPSADVAVAASPSRTHGRHRNASPPTSSSPQPLTRVLLLRAKPSSVQASMDVAGGAVLRRTSSALKSVCVSSSDLGPRSCDFGGRDCMAVQAEVWRVCVVGRMGRGVRRGMGVRGVRRVRERHRVRVRSARSIVGGGVWGVVVVVVVWC
jgi:hypothetical protein